MFVIKQKYERAKVYFDKALETAQSGQIEALVLHNLSQVYFYIGDHWQQEVLLLQTLNPEPDRYITHVDLEECYMMQRLNNKAIQTLPWLCLHKPFREDTRRETTIVSTILTVSSTLMTVVPTRTTSPLSLRVIYIP